MNKQTFVLKTDDVLLPPIVDNYPDNNLIGRGGSGGGTREINHSDSTDGSDQPKNAGRSGYNYNTDSPRNSGIVDILTNTSKGSDLPFEPFVPDPNNSPSENMSVLSDWIGALFAWYNVNGQFNGYDYGSVLRYVYDQISYAGGLFGDLSDAASLELAEKISDQMFTFITAQFQQALSYQSWYLQQEYNSPVNQINRLAEAGLNTAFAIGSLNSGNAQSMAGVPQVENPQMSNAGQAENQSSSNIFGLVGSIASSVLSFIPGLAAASGTALKDVTDAQIAKKLLPLEAAKMGVDIATNTQNIYKMRNDIELSKQNQAIKVLDNAFTQSSNLLSQAEGQVSQAESNYITMLKQATAEEIELGWETQVRDKSGNTRSYILNENEMRNIAKNGGRVNTGEVVVNSEGWDNLTSVELEAGLSKSKSKTSQKSTDSSSSQLIGESVSANNQSDFTNNTLSDSEGSMLSNLLGMELDMSGKARNDFSKSSSSSITSESGFESSHSSERLKGSKRVGYNEDGSEFHIGNSVFKSVQTRRLVTLPEFAEDLKRSRDYWQKSVDRYNALYDEQKTRLLYLQDVFYQNLSTFSGHLTASDYVYNLKQRFKPKTLQGD